MFGRKQKKLPVIVQNEMTECGHTCVAMIGNYWGHDLDLHSLGQIQKPSNRGITMSEMVRLFETLGFRSRALRVPLDELKHVKCPAILHWNMNHFVVLKQVRKKEIVIHDPATGVRRCRMDDVSNAFTGIVLEVEKTNDFKAIQASKQLTLYDLAKTITGMNKIILLLLLLSLSIEFLSLLNPLFMQFVTDDVIGSSDSHNLYVIASGFVLLILVQVFIEYVRGNMIIFISNHLTEQFASNVVRHLLKLPLDFFEKRHKGDIQSKFQSIDHIQKKIGTDFINTVLDGFMIMINVVVMLIYSRLLTGLVLMSLALFFSVRYASYRFLKRQTETSVVQQARASSLFLETLQGIVSIKSYLKESVRFTVWRNSYINSLNADIKTAGVNVLYQAANQLLFQLEHILVVCVGAALVLSNQFSVGMLIAFLAYRLLLVNKASSFIHNVFDYRLLSIQLNRLSDILFQLPETVSSGSRAVGNMQGSLTLKSLHFKYNPQDNYVLNNVSLDIKAGEKVAIIGYSGCGKSTLLKVMMGLFNATEGELLIDGIPINEFGLKNYREITASVMQDDALFSGSIRDNIAFFEEDIDIIRVEEAAKLANIHHDISKLPMGYETLVGDMGSILSGGQKQRILLARALYKRPKILFLDEATSHLDVDNERCINQSLKSLTMTQIIIAHRQETIQMADRIINLEEVNQCSVTIVG
jgi:ATP-binding cassette subfamily B protein RaxB